MNGFLYGAVLQWRLDLRSRTMLITCYGVPLLFFAVMGGIFTSIMPEAGDTLIASMTVFAVTMGALIGLPPCRPPWRRFTRARSKMPTRQTGCP